jgi:hypothetical protein
MKSLLSAAIPARLRPYNYLKAIVDRASQGRIVGGPFRGMNYVAEAVSSAFYPKLIGTYELELHPIIDRIVRNGFKSIVDIGAAEGYYACGLAKAIPGAKVLAFEADLKARYLLNQSIERNSLQERVTVLKFCDSVALRTALHALQTPILILCDAEGHEVELLSPVDNVNLRLCSILVETHDFLLPGLTGTLSKRFESTHQIEAIHTRPRSISDFPEWALDRYARLFPYKYLDMYLNERRPEGNCWLWMQPLSSAA